MNPAAKNADDPTGKAVTSEKETASAIVTGETCCTPEATAHDCSSAAAARVDRCADAKPDASAAESQKPMTLDQVRRQLKGKKGKRFWRSLDELADTPEFRAAVEREFPSAAPEWIDPVSRRGFLKLMGASMALAGLAG